MWDYKEKRKIFEFQAISIKTEIVEGQAPKKTKEFQPYNAMNLYNDSYSERIESYDNVLRGYRGLNPRVNYEFRPGVKQFIKGKYTYIESLKAYDQGDSMYEHPTDKIWAGNRFIQLLTSAKTNKKLLLFTDGVEVFSSKTEILKILVQGIRTIQDVKTLQVAQEPG